MEDVTNIGKVWEKCKKCGALRQSEANYAKKWQSVGGRTNNSVTNC